MFRVSYKRIVLSIAGLLVATLAWVKFEYGWGRPYPDLGAAMPSATASLEKLITLDLPPGNVAVASNGHVFFNYHPLIHPKRFADATVFEWADGIVKPFPSLEFQTNFQGTFGIAMDRQNRVWFTEPANFDFEHTRVWAFDITTRQQVHFFEFPKGVAQFGQDLRVTADGNYVLFANPGIFRFTASTLVAYSIRDHSYRTALSGGPCLQPEDWRLQTASHGPDRLLWGLLNFAIGFDGIEISPDQKWVYLGPMVNQHLCKVPLATVLDPMLTLQEADKQVEVVGRKPLSDGITVDRDGKVILTDVEHGGLMALDPATGALTNLVRSKEIEWADGVWTGPDNALYFTDSAIPHYLTQTSAPPDLARLVAHRPYYIYRVKN
jgi:sugar lactone lactonase YvrE